MGVGKAALAPISRGGFYMFPVDCTRCSHLMFCIARSDIFSLQNHQKLELASLLPCLMAFQCNTQSKSYSSCPLRPLPLTCALGSGGVTDPSVVLRVVASEVQAHAWLWLIFSPGLNCSIFYPARRWMMPFMIWDSNSSVNLAHPVKSIYSIYINLFVLKQPNSEGKARQGKEC